MLNVPLAHECMSTPVYKLHPDSSICDAVDFLASKSLSGVPVIDDDDNLVGILTEKDCLRVIVAMAYNYEVGHHVRDFMSPTRWTVHPSMDVFTAAQLFLENNFPSLPVVEEGKLLGLISRRDILNGIQLMQHQVDQVKKQRDDELRSHDGPKAIADLQKLAAVYTPEQLAAIFAMRHSSEHANA